MYNNELKLFQTSVNKLWTDEHISKSMLDAHLNETHDGASRKQEKRLKIINWINDKIKPNSKILDLGCGPGLYAYELGKLGHNVLGVDFNKESINYAKKNKLIKGYVDFKHGNYLTDKIAGKYNTAIMIYYDFGVLIPNEQQKLLERLNNLLQNDGLFIFDMYGTKEALNINNKEKDWYISNGGDFWCNEPYILMEETKYFEQEKRMCNRNFLVNQKNGKIKEFIVWEQCYDKDIIEKLFSKNGFEIKNINNDLLNDNGKTLFIVAQKKR